jgi:mono/diheme cytochrome c family protein
MKCSISMALRLRVLEAATAFAFLLGLCGTTFAAAPAGAPDKQRAKTLFQTKCATCHGPNGAGTALGK